MEQISKGYSYGLRGVLVSVVYNTINSHRVVFVCALNIFSHHDAFSNNISVQDGQNFYIPAKMSSETIWVNILFLQIFCLKNTT